MRKEVMCLAFMISNEEVHDGIGGKLDKMMQQLKENPSFAGVHLEPTGTYSLLLFLDEEGRKQGMEIAKESDFTVIPMVNPVFVDGKYFEPKAVN